MERAIALAWQGWGRTGSNPLVGAVVLRDGAVVGEGYHAEYGGAHGEVAALRAAGAAARGADLVVTLEPCRHHGKTPPCTDAILAAGVHRVVFGAPDVDPQARGGEAELRGRGVAVEAGLLADAVRRQNAVFFHRHSGASRPFVALKLALSADGRIADRERRSRWVSGPEAREWVQWLRAGYEAIAVGAGTVRADDPSLTARGPVAPLQPPLRVVFDRHADLPPQAKVVTTAHAVPTLIVVGPEAPGPRRGALMRGGAEVFETAGHAAALENLWKRGVTSVLVEGGGVLAGRLLAAGLVDRVHLILAPLFLGEEGVPAFAGLPATPLADARRWRITERRALGEDQLLTLDRT